ncbi:MAG TPA: DUF190 domain-containing protein [Niabella sp.]|nr:DUF190 domain-containing protein [Chitinophagaceae bacterium]HRO85831.1 DUF190 domain-containing protein [Niabella sp.]
MENNSRATALRIYVSNTDKFRNNLLYEVIVFAARRSGLAGATVHKGMMGFGSGSKIHSTKFWELTEKLPVVIEIIDDTAKIEQFIDKIKPWMEKVRYGCLITVEEVMVVLFKQGSKKKGLFDF